MPTNEGMVDGDWSDLEKDLFKEIADKGRKLRHKVKNDRKLFSLCAQEWVVCLVIYMKTMLGK